VQLSATSQTLTAERQTVPDETKPFVGQAALVPVQLSATSQMPAAERHWVPDDTNPSAGQTLLTPSQASATSHRPAADRQTVPDGETTSAGHAALVPVQVSAASQADADDRHTLAVLANVQLTVQQKPGAPLLPPRSHASLPSRTASPQIAPLKVAIVAAQRLPTRG
jgi:hypothetical protein